MAVARHLTPSAKVPLEVSQIPRVYQVSGGFSLLSGGRLPPKQLIIHRRLPFMQHYVSLVQRFLHIKLSRMGFSDLLLFRAP